MDKMKLSELFTSKVFQVPDYQRGYAWEHKQWNDFAEDIDALVTDDRVKSHYTGTVVTYDPKKESIIYNRKNANVVDVVDGQQRLTSVILYLSIIIRMLVKKGEREYELDIPEFLYDGTTCKLTLNNDTSDLFYQLIKEGTPRRKPVTAYQKRICDAAEYFKKHIKDYDKEYLRKLFAAITGNLVFTFYTIEEECEIGMTFELMNSRGKGLSVLELLKNYLMHWIARNGTDEERQSLTDTVNSAWKDTYFNVGNSLGNDEQCLRIAWVLYCHHLPKNWKGYDGFKSSKYIPLRDFTVKSREETKEFILLFANGLAEISKQYSIVSNPKEQESVCKGEMEWLSKIHNSGNTANFLPLMISARTLILKQEIASDEYINMLKALECFAYRVFLAQGKRSNAGKSSFYRWGKSLYEREVRITNITNDIYRLIRYYAPEEVFIEQMKKPTNWYIRKVWLRYTLFEYEKFLLDSESKGQKPRITWTDLLKDSTLEHILPQTPEENSHWMNVWSTNDIQRYLHDIGNIVLTRDNSSYKNFEFSRKKGKVGSGVGYSNSDIRQERKIASYHDWTADEFMDRRKSLEKWMLQRWSTIEVTPADNVDEDADVEDSEIAT